MGLSQQIGASSLAKPGVCTSTTRPATPYEGQMIYETDTDLVRIWNGTAWVEINSALTKAPRGIMGVQTLTTAFTTSATHTTSQAAGMTLTFNEVSGRVYRIVAYTNLYPSGGLQAITFRMLRNSVQVRRFEVSSVALDTLISFPQALSFVYTSASTGSVTFSTAINAYANNTAVMDYADAAYFRQFLIEDIGAA